MAVEIFMDMPGGQKMPAIGLGTGELSEETDLENSLNAALEMGYRHIDTAFAYENEAFIGRVLEQWFSSGKLNRQDVFITTKLPMNGMHEDRVDMFMQKSLENLQLDYVDLYLVHFPIGTKYIEGKPTPGPGDDEEEEEIDGFDHIAIWKKMEEQVDSGKAKNIGLSNFSQSQIEKINKSARIKPACLQVEIHVDFQQRELVDFCHENGIVVVAYSPLGSPGDTSRSSPVMLDNEVIMQMAQKYEKSSAQIMLRHHLQRNIVAIPKSSNPKRLKENIDVFDFSLDPADMEALENLEVGEKARLATFRFISGIEQHPEYPFPK